MHSTKTFILLFYCQMTENWVVHFWSLITTTMVNTNKTKDERCQCSSSLIPLVRAKVRAVLLLLLLLFFNGVSGKQNCTLYASCYTVILFYYTVLCLALPVHVFWSGRKPEYPEETHANTGRTCKLHTERPGLGRKRTQDLLAVRQQR